MSFLVSIAVETCTCMYEDGAQVAAFAVTAGGHGQLEE